VFVTETAVFVKEVTVFVIEATAFVTETAALEHRRGGGEAVGGRAAGLRWDSHGIPPGTEKAALGAAFFTSYPLLSEYQVQPKNTPNIFAGIRAEVVWNVGPLLWIFEVPLDKFSTKASLAFGSQVEAPIHGPIL
jgi:hypothetical protein